jgi:hypothetical protein
MDGTDPLGELRSICAGARMLMEAGHHYIDLPGLTFLSNGSVIRRDGLLSIEPHSGYTTRLFLSTPVPGKGNNWSVHTIVGRTWHTWSWNNVPANLRLAEILAEHLRALR